MDIKTVLIVDGVGPNCAELLRAYGIEAIEKPKITKEQLLAEIHNYDVLVVRSATQVTNEVMTAANGRLQVIARAGAGVDNIDIDSATVQRIGVINAPGANALSACELTCCLMMAMARHIVPAATALRQGRWERTHYTGTELAGKTVAILGLGRVGKEVAWRMHAFGMNCIGYDPYLTRAQCLEFNTHLKTLDEIWPEADYITLHTPLMNSTRNMLNAKVFAKCKKGVKIINVGRGGLVNEVDLLEALESGQVGAAALDVFEEEPPTDPLTIKIIQHPSVIATPHLGASTQEAQVRVGQEIAEQLVNLVRPRTFRQPIAEVTNVLPDYTGPQGATALFQPYTV